MTADKRAHADTSTRESSSETDSEPGVADDDRLELAARLDLLEEENRRLRTEYARAKQSTYRRTAYGLFAVGMFTFLAGLLLPDGREVLFVLGATGLFGGVLTLYLTPTRFVAADVGERVYTAMTANYTEIADHLGLTGTQVYLPGENRAAHLYLPQSTEYERPDLDEGPFVAHPSRRGLLLEATGALLFDEFERTVTGPVATRPDQLATQLAEAVVEQFELADGIDADIDRANTRLTFRVTGSALGDVDRIDHPLASFLASGCAAALETPVILDVESTTERADWLVTLRWDSENDTNTERNDTETTR